jgi:hypothetical protein
MSLRKKKAGGARRVMDPQKANEPKETPVLDAAAPKPTPPPPPPPKMEYWLPKGKEGKVCVQVGMAEFNDAVTAHGAFFNSFMHADNGLLHSCWKVGDDFIIVTAENKLIVINNAHVQAWTTLLPLNLFNGEHMFPVSEQESICKARQLAGKE